MKKISLAFFVFMLLGALPVMASAQSNELPPGQLIKAHSSDTVYYIDSDLRRYVFPNARIFNSWYESFGEVIEVTDDEISGYQLGGNVLYKPGKRLVKLMTDPKVYAVDDGGTLRWVKSEKAARALYGNDWNQFVDDLSDAFFANYTIGEDIDGPENFDMNIHKRIRHIGQILQKLRKEMNKLRNDYLEQDDDENDSYGRNRVAVCHNFGDDHPHTIFIAKPALNAHLKHGDTAGRCDGDTQDGDDGGEDDSDDGTAPVFGDIVTSDVTMNEATLSWTTDEATSYTLYYATTSPVDTSTAEFFGSGVLTESWGATVRNLLPGTTYYAVIVAADEAGNDTTSVEQSFTTEATPDEIAPVVSELIASGITQTQATLSWTTDEATTYTLYYAAMTPVDLETAESMSSGVLAESQNVTFSFLLPETDYHVVVVAVDESGNETVTEEFMFTTAAGEPAPDETAPILSDIVTSDVTDTKATLSWTTDEATSYTLYYATTSPVDTGTVDAVAYDVLSESGEETLTELLPETDYYVVVVAADEAGNEATSAEQTFTTAVTE
ncbi:fibronectin type III domain-containing protein [Patescibacteria group bacterium]